MSRQNNCRHKSESWPHLCAWHVQDGLQRRIRVDAETQCWVWQGWFTGHRPALFLRMDGKRKVAGQANHLLWWQRHGERIMSPEFLENTCGTLHCCNPDHLRKSSFKRRRRWTMREVKQLREAYWGTETVPGRRARTICPNSALILTAKHFNVSRNAIYNFNRGRARLYKWPDPKTTHADVMAVLEKNKAEVAKNALKRRTSLTLFSIGKQYGTMQSVVRDMLIGHTYRNAEGPTAPVRQSAHKLRIA